MATIYPAGLDTTVNIPTVINNITPLNATYFNSLQGAIFAIEGALGVNPAGTSGTVAARLTALQNSTSNITLNTQDLGGTYALPLVIGLQGYPISNQQPQTGNVLTWLGSAWAPIASTDLFSPGGDLSGNGLSQTVIGLQGRPISSQTPTTNYVLTWNGSVWAPAASATNFIVGGNLSGSSGSQTVIAINGATVPASGSLTTGNTLQVNGSNSLTYGPLNLAGGGNYISGVLPSGNQASQSLTLTGDVTGVGTTFSTSTIVANISGSGGVVTFNATIVGNHSNSYPVAFGVETLTLSSDANYVLTGPQLIYPFLRVSSSVSLTATRTITLPGTSGAVYYVFNSTTGGQSLTFQAATGTGVTVPNGLKAVIYFDGTNYVITNVMIGGDLTATSNIAQTVAKINGSSVPAGGALTTGNTLQVSGSSTLTYGALNLAGGSNYVTGVLPTGNQAPQSVGGDLSGTAASATVIRLQNNPVQSGALGISQDGYVLTWVNSASMWEPRASSGGGGGGFITPITTNYNVQPTDTFISVGTLSSIITITLMASPISDDTVVIKDTNGSAAQYPISIAGNGKLIDGLSSITISNNYGYYRLTYTGTQWSVN